MSRVTIHGVDGTIRQINKDYGTKRKDIKRVSVRITEDLLRKARDNAPVLEGTLVDSGSAEVIDLGKGKGFRLIVGFDTPYALKMHESHYTAQNPHKSITAGGVTVPWSKKRGRKYLDRAWKNNKAKYFKALEAIGD